MRRGNVLVFFAWLHLRHRHRNKPCHLYPTNMHSMLLSYIQTKIAFFTCQENLYRLYWRLYGQNMGDWFSSLVEASCVNISDFPNLFVFTFFLILNS